MMTHSAARGQECGAKLTETKCRRRGRVRSFFANLGPGLITGAADDDPSGISTYSTAGAGYGFGLLWTAAFSLPLMASVQLMCARIGLVSGRGLTSVLRHYYSRRLLWFACLLLLMQFAHTCHWSDLWSGSANCFT